MKKDDYPMKKGKWIITIEGKESEIVENTIRELLLEFVGKGNFTVEAIEYVADDEQ